jgi:RNA-directed DNA polymerase
MTDFERVYDYQSLYEAYLRSRKAKRYRSEVLQFSYHLEENLIELQNELIWKTYEVGRYRPFIVHDPKTRQVVALPFRDRVVQHSLNAVLEPYFERRMIRDSYACRVGKGTHEAARRVSYFLGKPDVHYYLKADIKSYFQSVNHRILWSLLTERIDDEDILWLVEKILESTPGTGLPIGNLMSQLFANVYLHELDHLVKNVLGVKYYVRYMDDFLIFHPSKSALWALLEELRGFLENDLALRLNQKTRIDKASRGVEFVGYRIWRNNKLIKKQSLNRMRRKARAWRNGKMDDDQFLASVGSWVGHARDTASHQEVEKLLLMSLQHAAFRGSGRTISHSAKN